VVGPAGALFDGDAILRGQGVWQAMGGQEVGSVWGHGAYVAPDWTADWLHREAVFVLDRWARAEGAGSYAALGPEHQAALRQRLEHTMRRITLDPETGTLRLGPERAAAFGVNAAYYAELLSKGSDPYAIQADAVDDPARARDLAAFFWWTSWAASTARPAEEPGRA
jgi:nitric oxide reductase subunit B